LWKFDPERKIGNHENHVYLFPAPCNFLQKLEESWLMTIFDRKARDLFHPIFLIGSLAQHGVQVVTTAFSAAVTNAIFGYLPAAKNSVLVLQADMSIL